LWPKEPSSRRDEPPLAVYALLDAARDERIFAALLEFQDEVELASLYQGKLGEDLAEVAPYLARLQPQHPFTHWLIDAGWGRSFGVFFQARLDFDEARRHFRKLTLVWTEDGESLIFRFYDPRVLKLFLPTCASADLATLFGPVERFIVEGEDGVSALRLECRDGALTSLPVALVAGAVRSGGALAGA
jgi:hypothetical protein